MAKIEMFVNLKVPDNTAITAFNTLKKIGYKNLRALHRSLYYNFEVSENEVNFKDKISSVDILVNSNKHNCSFFLDHKKSSEEKNQILNSVDILILDEMDTNSLLFTLKKRLGFPELLNVSKGVVWSLFFGNNCDSHKISIDITKNLLMNENFQKYKILKKNG
jgi:phosphoribosylformylglycinamidine (FGAM) synthase PurS component